MTKLQGSPFFVVIRCTLPLRNSTSRLVEGCKNGAICVVP